MDVRTNSVSSRTGLFKTACLLMVPLLGVAMLPATAMAQTQVTFTVNKTYSDPQAWDPEVEINLECTGASITSPNPVTTSGKTVQFILQFDPFINGPAGATCSASETIPLGYVQTSNLCTSVFVENPETPASIKGSPPIPGPSCTITNRPTAATLYVDKIFSDSNPELGVTVTPLCTDAAGGPAITYSPASGQATQINYFTATVKYFNGATNCTATETDLAGYTQDLAQSTCDEGVPVTDGNTANCQIYNQQDPAQLMRATFAVTKEFTDGNNPTEVNVTLSCFTGLPLIQSQYINEEQGVTFVVESFNDGELDCEISEDLDAPELLGYTPTYTAGGTPGGSSDDDGCYFDDVPNGAENTCAIVNDADPVPLEIVKEWIIDGIGGDQVDQRFELTLYCDSEIVDAYPRVAQAECGGIHTLVANGQIRVPYESCLELEGSGDTTFTPHVYPQWPSSHCWVVEHIYDDSVEVDNDCGNLTVSHGQGDSCLITNTVFFEGIPTLSQYGMAILALLMLGAGLVGFRRFA